METKKKADLFAKKMGAVLYELWPSISLFAADVTVSMPAVREPGRRPWWSSTPAMPPLTDATAADGPVIGGNAQLGVRAPPPPPPDVKGPGAGNLSGLVLILAIFAALIGKIAQKALSNRPSAAMRAAQKKATQMAAEIRKAGQQKPSPDKGKPKKELPKSKRKANESSAKFSRLGMDEEEASGVGAEECGEEEDEDSDRGEPQASGWNKNAGAAGRNKCADSGSALCFGAARKSGGAVRGPEPEDESVVESAMDFGAESESSFYNVKGEDDGNSAFDIGGGDDDDDFDDDPDDDISPNDSVSNIGFSQPMASMRYQRQRKNQRYQPSGSCARMMPSVSEAEHEEASGGSPGSAFRGLDELDQKTSKNLSRNDDAFSMVHAQHMAMRSRIPGDEMPVNLRDPAANGGKEGGGAATGRGRGGKGGTAGSAQKPKRVPGSMRPVSQTLIPAPHEPPQGDDDACSAVTFNFAPVAELNEDLARLTKAGRGRGSDGRGTGGRAARGAPARLPPPPMMDAGSAVSDDSDAASSVAFGFQASKPAAKKKGGRL